LPPNETSSSWAINLRTQNPSFGSKLTTGKVQVSTVPEGLGAFWLVPYVARIVEAAKLHKIICEAQWWVPHRLPNNSDDSVYSALGKSRIPVSS
jgi:hypothetical protein